MKTTLAILFLVLSCSFLSAQQTMTYKDFATIHHNFCDTLWIEVTGLYENTDSLPPANEELLQLDDLLKSNDFSVTSSGWGNWEKGPRIICLTLEKTACKCEVCKRYYTIENSEYRITESVKCHEKQTTD